MPDLYVHFMKWGFWMKEPSWTMEPSNFVYVRTFDGWEGHYYAYVTCIGRNEERRICEERPKDKPRLQKIVPKNGPDNVPSPGFYKADEPPYTDCPTPSFFFLDIFPQYEETTIHRVENIDFLQHRNLLQTVKDTEVHIVDLDLVHEPPEEGATLKLSKISESRGVLQRMWFFQPSAESAPMCRLTSTPFHDVLLGTG